MKIKKTEKKLILKKNTVAHLNGSELKKILGGGFTPHGPNSAHTNCISCGQ